MLSMMYIWKKAKQIIADRVIDRLIGVQLVKNKLVFEFVSKNLDGLKDNTLKLCNLLNYTDNNFLVYKDANFGTEIWLCNKSNYN